MGIEQQQEVDWASLVGRIQAKETAAIAEFYTRTQRGLRRIISRRLGAVDFNSEGEDLVSATVQIVIQSIQDGRVAEPARIMGFVRTVALRQVSAFIERAVAGRSTMCSLEAPEGANAQCPSQNPEEQYEAKQRRKLIADALAGLGERDRELLVRFYIKEQSPEQIMAEMGLNETQFRLLKSRAKGKFGKTGQKLAQKTTTPLLARLGIVPSAAY